MAENCVKKLIAANKNVKDAKVAILGFTFKENCPDCRNTKVIDIKNELEEYGIDPVVADPQADAEEVRKLYDIEFTDIQKIQGMDAVILAVAHKEYKMLELKELDKLYGEGIKVFLDIKGVFHRKEYEEANYLYWRF